MRQEKKHSIGEREFTIKELTLAEIRNWQRQAEQQAQGDDASPALDLGDALFVDVTVADLLLMTDAEAEELEELAPSELRQLADACREVNEHFFAMADRLGKAYQQALDKLQEAGS